MVNQPGYWLSLPRDGAAIAHLANAEGKVLCRLGSAYRATIPMPENSRAKTCWECMQTLKAIDSKAYRIFYLSGVGKPESLSKAGSMAKVQAISKAFPQSLSHRNITKP